MIIKSFQIKKEITFIYNFVLYRKNREINYVTRINISKRFCWKTRTCFIKCSFNGLLSIIITRIIIHLNLISDHLSWKFI